MASARGNGADGCRSWAAGADRRGETQVQEVDTGFPSPEAVVSWTEEQLLEMATSLPATRTIRHQPRARGKGRAPFSRKLLENHTHYHNQKNKRRDSESLQVELAAARWAWLGRACGGSENGDDKGLTLGQWRKLSLVLAAERATLAETGAWTELLRMYGLTHVEMAHALRSRALHRKRTRCVLRTRWTRATSEQLYRSCRPTLVHRRTCRAAAELPCGELETARIKVQCAAIKQAALKTSPPPTWREGPAGGGTGPTWMAQRGYCGHRTL